MTETENQSAILENIEQSDLNFDASDKQAIDALRGVEDPEKKAENDAKISEKV